MRAAPRKAMASSSKDVEAAAARLCTHYTDAATTLFNEPSLGLYYVVEHVQRGVPALVAVKQAVRAQGEQLQGAETDAAFALANMEAATSAGTLGTFDRVEKLAEAAAARAAASSARAAASSAPLSARPKYYAQAAAVAKPG